MEQLLNELAAIHEQMAQMNQENPREAAQYDRLKEQADKLQAQIEAHKQSDQERAVIVENAKTEIANSFDAIEYEGETYTIDTFASNEVAAQALKIFFTSRYAAQAEAFSKQIAEIKADHGRDLNEQRELNQSLKEQLAQVVMEKEDAEAKRDAAVREAEIAKAEAAGKELLVSEKQAQIDKLREEIAIGAVGAVKVVPTNVDNDAIREAMKAWKESLPAIINVRWENDLRKTHYLAERVDNGETIRIPHLEKGKYREVTDEEAARFRAELAEQAAGQAAESNQESVQDSPLVTPPPLQEVTQFQEPEAGLDEDATVRESDAEALTLEQRVARLEAHVFAKNEVNGEAA